MDYWRDQPPLRELIAASGLAARKSLGQHFLLDRNLCDKIVRESGVSADLTVIEIGPGPGGLTRSLLNSAAKQVIALERDDRAIGLLQPMATAAGERLTLCSTDALEVSLSDCGQAPRAVVANLPYNIGTTLLLRWLHEIEHWQSLTLMLQKEVIERLLAKPNSKAYGRLSVLVQLLCDGQKLLTVPASAFTPPPRVTSAVIKLTPKASRPAANLVTIVEKITAAAFGQRRKTLGNSLQGLLTTTALTAANINPSHRAEQLTPNDFLLLAKQLSGSDR